MTGAVLRAEVPEWRSILFVPADQPRFIDKAHLRGADAIQLDGRMIDRPIVMRAQRWLHQARQGTST